MATRIVRMRKANGVLVIENARRFTVNITSIFTSISTMAVPNNPFRFILPLQHMAKVKAVEMLWRTQNVRQITRDTFAQSAWRLPIVTMGVPEKQIEALEQALNRLSIPEMLKKELMIFIMQMASSVTSWIEDTLTRLSENHVRGQECAEMLEYCIDNFSWNNMGYADGRKILHSYVHDKQSIDYPAWMLLCHYCMEEDILKFSPTINWNSCKSFTSSDYCIYWYRKVYGKLPTKDMFNPLSSYAEFQSNCSTDDAYSSDYMLKQMVQTRYGDWLPLCNRSDLVFRYLRKVLGDEHRFQEMYLAFLSKRHRHDDDVMPLSLLGSINDEEWLQSTDATSLICHMAIQWPFMLFSEHWTTVLEDRLMEETDLPYMFERLHMRVSSWNEKYRGQLLDRHRCAFRQYLKLFNKQIGINKELTYDIVFKFFWNKSTDFCRAIFEGMEHYRRIDFLKRLQREITLSLLNDEEFCTRFMEDVLVSEEERSLFQRIINAQSAIHVNWNGYDYGDDYDDFDGDSEDDDFEDDDTAEHDG